MTGDLGVRCKFIEDDAGDSVKALVSNCTTLRILELGVAGIKLSALDLNSKEMISP